MTEEIKLIESLSIEQLQELLQSMGYRVTVSEREGARQLLSATQGIGFSVRPGNPGQAPSEFIDYTLSCPLHVQGDIPTGLVESWNIRKRFGRLAQQASFLVLEKDVIVAGGVSPKYLRATTELWDRLMQELVLFLKDYVSNNAVAAAPSQPGDAAPAAPGVQPTEGEAAPLQEPSGGKEKDKAGKDKAGADKETAQ
ncbi:YbjN domain-containing protein [Achromobacter pestifer]|uniref:YbjN domain-containing protein n=1 Tax=Achromobacter pestifer TaxID=1353889 RepID=A0A6S6ZGT1_9BURK|nr:YbjN domain-containing protein [Achromobacter pestifer]CAB3647268.1 hypothetical protein LMG3431_02554 [Achromobacter pestifer]